MPFVIIIRITIIRMVIGPENSNRSSRRAAHDENVLEPSTSSSPRLESVDNKEYCHHIMILFRSHSTIVRILHDFRICEFASIG